MNPTIRRFGYPATLIAEYAHWVVLLRPQQPTLGSLVLAAKSQVEGFGALPRAAFADLATAIAAIEGSLRRAIVYEKINYLMLMMVDRHVHFHVLPRYQGERAVAGIVIPDAGWPKAPVLDAAVTLDSEQTAALVDWLKAGWAP